MSSYNFVKGYQEDSKLRESLNQLAEDTFGINFESWYQSGYWNERYIPYSFVNDKKVIANVSVNLLDLIIEGERKEALQIGTVMTHPEYRKQGLSAMLLHKIIEEYEEKVDFMYLFANETVLIFYPKFGFKPIKEQQFSMNFNLVNKVETNSIKLNISNPEDLQFIYFFAKERVPVSSKFGSLCSQGILMFYCINVFSDDIYYLEDEQAIVIYKVENQQLELFDVISKREVDIVKIINKISKPEIKQVIFHFTPDINKTSLISNPYDDGLFVRSNHKNGYPEGLKHPITSQA